MAELPEIVKIAGQMLNMLGGKKIERIEIKQERCSNISSAEFDARARGAVITDVSYRGKWILIYLGKDDVILLSPGMGADILYFTDDNHLPGKFQIEVLLDSHDGFTVRFWWFGRFMLIPVSALGTEPAIKDIAVDPFDSGFTYEYFKSLLAGRKGQIKPFLLNQKNVGGIGNMYMHDILFQAGLHPQARISDMSEPDIRALYDAIQNVLGFSRDKGAFSYEYDFLGNKGGYTPDDFLVGYRAGQPCPTCGEPITAIKTGQTSSYICPACQKKK